MPGEIVPGLRVDTMFVFLFTFHLELHGTGCRTEAVERGGRVLEVERLGVVVVGRVHRLEFRVVLEHVDFGFPAVIIDQLTGDTEPDTVLKSTELGLGIGRQLLGNILDLAGLDVKLAVIEIDRAKRPDPRLVALDRRQVVGTGFLQKLTDSLNS